MTWSADLDLLAATMAYNTAARMLAGKWLSTNPSKQEIDALAEELRNSVKGAHSENSLPPEIELKLVERMIVLIDQFFQEFPPIDPSGNSK